MTDYEMLSLVTMMQHTTIAFLGIVVTLVIALVAKRK